MQNRQPPAFPLYAGKGDIILYRMSGISSSRQRLLNGALSIAAIGFVAFILVFVHPASQAAGGAAYWMRAGSDVVIAATGIRPRLAASR
jgi:hypothetical protein